MKRIVLGVIGHVDHGKTALVRVLTGQDTDRLPEEKRRGISIALGFAHAPVADGVELDVIDMPGHERFVRTMVAGATGIDAVLLVVAANEGVKPQTVEHVDIAGLLGLRRAVVAVSKTDLVADDQARAVAGQALALLRQAGLDPSAAVLTSATPPRGIDALKHALAALANEQAPRRDDGSAFLPIDRAFAVAGHGPVATGTLRGATIAADDTLELWPGGRRVRVRGVQIHGAAVRKAEPGQRVGLNLRDVAVADLHRGMALAAPASLAPSEWLTLHLRSVNTAPPLRNGKRLKALFGTSEIEVRLRLLDRDALEPGASCLAQLHGDAAIVLPVGEHVVLRLISPSRTVAGGRVLEAETPRRRRHDAAVLERLADLRDLPPAALIAAEARRAGLQGTTLQRLARLAALSPARTRELAHALPLATSRTGLVVWQPDMERLLARIPDLLEARKEGLAREGLLAKLPEASQAVLDAAVGRLLTRRTIIERGGRLTIPRPLDDLMRVRNDTELSARIERRMQQAGLTPPNPSDLITDASTKRAVERLLRAGVLVRAHDRAKGRELLFHRAAIDAAKKTLAPLLRSEPGLLVSDIAAALNVSRKFCMPLLDHLDGAGFTRRVGDRRLLSLTWH